MANRLGAGPTGRVVLLCLLSASPALAQGTVDGLRSLYKVDGRNAAIEESHALVPLLPPSPSYLNQVGDGPLWRQADNGEGWIGRVVGLGDRGTQVFTEFDTAADRAELVSGFDSTPVSPLFTDPQNSSSDNAKVSAARDVGVYVSCRQIHLTGQSGPSNSFVSMYSATGGLGWTYQFQGTTNGPVRAGISRDGTRIVAGMLDSAGVLQVRVFNSSSNVPIYSTSFVNGPQLRAFLLSADGSTLYFASATAVSIWNVPTHQLMGSYILLNALDCHAISADGGVFAYGGFNNVDVWERQPAGNYLRTYQWAWPGQVVCSKVEVSGDGSTIVAGFNIWDFTLGVTIKALDVPSKMETMTDTAIGAGTLQNIVSDIAVCDDGHHFVVGLWGDEAGLVPELRFYENRTNNPVATFNYPGSVNEVDISPDGRRVGVATKAVHANEYAGGGAIELYAFDDEDFIVHGIPHAGSPLTFEMSSLPNTPARLLISPQAAVHPFQWGGAGLLYLNRQHMYSMSMGMTGLHGYATVDFPISALPATIGTTLCFQGLVTAPRRLTHSWIRMTVVP